MGKKLPKKKADPINQIFRDVSPLGVQAFGRLETDVGGVGKVNAAIFGYPRRMP